MTMRNYVNLQLARERGISEADLEKLNILHEELEEIVDDPELHDNPKERIEAIEYQLQRLWKFPEDRDFHTHWSRLKGCTCDSRSMDNMELRGAGVRAIEPHCPWHGFPKFPLKWRIAMKLKRFKNLIIKRFKHVHH